MQHDFTLAANGTQTIDVAGRFFKYKSGTGMIRIRATKGGYIDLKPGQGVENEEFTSLTISDRTGAANAGIILAGDFNFRDETISGTVDVVDGGKSRTTANLAFFSNIGAAQVAGQYSYNELWNPVGSGRNLVVESICASTAVGGVAQLHNQPATIGVQSSAPVSKKMSGGASVGLAYQGSSAANLGAQFHGVYLAANQNYTFKFVEPLIVPPGFGVSVNGVVNQDISAVFEYFEDQI